MAPPKQACEVILAIELAYAKLLDTIQDILKKIQIVIDLKSKIKYGLIDVADAVSADIIAAIGSIAASVSKSILGAISGMASTILESILSSLLSILLSAPTAIFSFIAIPHSQARQAAHIERECLLKALENIRLILSIISKWTDGFSGGKFYEQMKNALPYISKAIQISVELLIDLNKDEAVLNESKYNAMLDNIQTAEDITKPMSVIDSKFGLTRAMEQRRDEIYNKLTIEINNTYNKKRKNLTEEFQKQMLEIGSGPDLNYAIKTESIRNKYSFNRSVIETERKEKLQLASLQATTQASIDGSAYVKAIKGLGAEFVYDMEILLKTIKSLASNISKAYIENKRCQHMCHAIYTIRELISNLINELIYLIRKTTIGSVKVASKSIDSAQTLLEVVNDKFTSCVDRYEDVTSKISDIEMSLTVVAGNELLLSAEAILNSTITRSLIDHINSDDVLKEANKDFEEFYKKLEDIPDWDGKKNAWAVQTIGLAASPYIKLTTDSATLVIRVPTLSLSNSRTDRQELIQFMMDLQRIFNTILVHNLYVTEVLNSYTPYMSSEIGNLMRILSNAGLLETFANGLSIVATISDITKNVIKSGIDSFAVTSENCMSSYPDLYKSPDAARASALFKYNMPARTADLSFLKKCEDKDYDRIGVQSYIKNINFNNMINEEDLIES
jgi:hypothetical protein